ncbi:helix-turn-helix domain-containing protein [Pseudonocardia asaccharolytica]|uniref:AraC family transcriptional regulator n=1 Tax=Pseudonocardia asaccharolytica DSM 44247 = NBRC 16224 TaxID=1123024 RepID=A0A511D155_9PSEU|nr:helix-turn-helix domain-containing protein [Pseudonocardia asaccharolytica]GEL18530.1 AraC family transcriptional regulator [Pseudonocardia asaccharolytica DSM 44247 = NBRC 16224]
MGTPLAAAHTRDELVWTRPSPALRDYVTGCIGYRIAPTEPATHQGVPSAHLTLLLCLDGTVELLRMPDPARSPGSFSAMVGGLHNAPAVIAQGPPQTGLQLRLTWRGARALLDAPAGLLAGDVVDLGALLGNRIGPLLDRLATAPSWAERFALLDATLTRLAMRRRREPPPEVGYAWDRLAAAGGMLRIEELAREVGWSRRHLADRFRREIGLAPKAAARVIRFERACDMLRAARRPALAAVASECGYVDQAHLARDFRDLAGITATAWLAERPS